MAMTDATTLSVINTKRIQGVEGEVQKLQRSRKHITLYNDGGTWKVKDHTVDSPAFATLDPQTSYEPPFDIRGINLEDDTDASEIINYDTSVSGRDDTKAIPPTFAIKTVTFKDISERLSTNIIHPISATKIYLASSDTTATTIHLHG